MGANPYKNMATVPGRQKSLIILVLTIPQLRQQHRQQQQHHKVSNKLLQNKRCKQKEEQKVDGKRSLLHSSCQRNVTKKKLQ
jgi:hypothetical protein